MQKIIRAELGSIHSSLEFTSEQVTVMEQSIQKQENKIKLLENKNIDLINKNKNLELRVASLEQQIQDINQKFLTNTLEISGLPESTSDKNVLQLVKNVGEKLEVDVGEIQSARRLPARRDQPGPIVVEMKTKASREEWVAASRKFRLKVRDVLGDAPSSNACDSIFIRESLTLQTKSLLYNTKRALSESFQFIWCKEGRIYARQSSGSKIHTIRSVEDIKSLKSTKNQEPEH